MKILELGAQNNDAFNSIIENAESHGKKGIPGERQKLLINQMQSYVFSID